MQIGLRRRLRRAAVGVARRVGRTSTPLRALDHASRAVALTFDDGPDPVYTPLVLDRLRAHGIVATFFVVGERAERYPELLRRIVAEGHAIGSHSHSHAEGWELSTRQLVREYRGGRRAAERALGRRVRLFRPPNGYINGRSEVAMAIVGLRPWLWTLDPRDWEPGTGVDGILGRLEAMTSGDVILLHDAIERPLDPTMVERSHTVDAVEGIAALAAERGLTFATLR